jgi:hypothetical protein
MIHGNMRRLVFLFLAGFIALPLRAAVPELLDAALQKIAADHDRWAYTQEVVEKDDKGKVMSEAVVRFDPSKPYEQQFTPVSVNGKPPSDHQIRKYRRQGEKRGDRLEKAEREGKEPTRQTLGELMDIGHATVVEENAQSVTYEVPLKKEGNNRLPPEKFRVTARVSKQTQAFENIVVLLREPLRAALIVKVKSGVGRLEFETVNPKFAPALTALHGGGTASILFVSVGRSYDVKRSDFKRVKPYVERFGVKFGPLKAIDF